ncbi:MAG: EF-hand domain-containing protein [Pseudomonadota bacterium]
MKPSAYPMIIAATAVAVTAVSAQARGQGPDFATLDQDGNGVLTREEMQAAAQARFDRIDQNGNGQLSQAEIEAQSTSRAARRAERMIARLDSNGDGQLSAQELAERRDTARAFDRIDRDNSGTITQAEFDLARQKMRDRRNSPESD